MSGRKPEAKRLAVWLAGLSLCWACATTGPATNQPSLYSVNLPRADATRLHFNRFRDRVLMIDFFTTWAPSAVANATGYSKLYTKYQEQGLSVVGVSLDELGARVIEPFVQGLDIPYPVVPADKTLLEGESFFGTIGAAPMLMIFDRDGVLVTIFVGHVPISDIEKIIVRVLH